MFVYSNVEAAPLHINSCVPIFYERGIYVVLPSRIIQFYSYTWTRIYFLNTNFLWYLNHLTYTDVGTLMICKYSLWY